MATLHSQQHRPEQARVQRDHFQKLSEADLASTRERIRTSPDGVSRSIAIEAHNECARVFLQGGDSAAAETLWRKAAVLNPRDVESRTQLAHLYERTNRERLALCRCEQLRNLQPDNPDHWLNLGLLSARLGRLAVAQEAVAKAIELNPQEPKYRRVYDAISQPR